MRGGGSCASGNAQAGKKSKSSRGRARLLRAVEALESRLLLSAVNYNHIEAGTTSTITQTSGGTTLAFNDTTNSNMVTTVTLGNGDTVTGGAAIDFSGVGSLEASTSQLTLDGITINYTAQTGTPQLSVPSPTTLTIDNTASGAVGVTTSRITFGGITVGYSGVSNITVNGNSGTMSVSDGTSGQTVTLSSSSVSFNSTTVNYSSLTAVSLSGAGGSDTYNINSTHSGTPVTVNSDTTSTSNIGGGNVDQILSTVTVNHGSLSVDDSSSSSAGAMTFAGGVLTARSATIDYSGLSSLNLKLGSGGDVVSVLTSTVAQSQGITITSQTASSNQLIVGNGSISGIATPVTIQGMGSDSLTVNDSTDSSGRGSAVVSSTSISGLGGGAITYNNDSNSAVTSLTVNLGSAADTLAVQSTSATTTNINSGSAANTFTVGNNHSTSGITGTLTIAGNGGGSDQLTIDDGSGAANTSTIFPSSVSGLSTNAISYSGIGTLTVDSGTGTVNVSDTSATTNVNVPAGANTVNVTANSNPTTITTGGSGNTINVTSSGVIGPIGGVGALLTINAASGDSMTVDDSGALSNGSTITIATGTLTVRTATINYSGISTLTVHAGFTTNNTNQNVNVVGTSATTTTIDDSGGQHTYNVSSDSHTVNITTGSANDAVNVKGTGASSTTNITTGAGTDAVNVGSNAPGSGGTLSPIAGAVSVTGPSSNCHTTLTLDDTGNGSSPSLTLSGGSVGNVSYSQIAGLQVNLGSGNDTVSVTGTSVPTTISGGSGNDTFTLNVTNPSLATVINTGTGNDAVNVQAITAATTVNAGSGNDTITAGSSHVLSNIKAQLKVTGQSSTSLSVDDSSDSSSTTGALSASAVTGLNFGSGGSMVYSGVGAVSVSLGTASNTFTVTGTSAATNTITSQGNDTINVAATAASTTTVITDANNNTNVTVGSNNVLNTIAGGVNVSHIKSLTLSDTGDAGTRTGTITSTGVTGFGITGPGVTYSDVNTLNVNLGSGGNTVNITGTSGSTATNVNSGSGNDHINVQGTGGSTTISTGTGSNVVFVGSNAPNGGGTVGGIATGLTIHGGPSDTMTVDDAGDTGSPAINTTPTNVTIGSTSINYSGFSTVTVNSPGGGTVVVNPAINALIVKASISTQQIVTVDEGAQNVTVSNPDGSAATTSSFSGFSSVSVAGQFFGGAYDALIIKGTTGNDNFSVTGTSVALTGHQTVFFSTFASLWVYGGGGNDTVTSSFSGSSSMQSVSFIDGTLVNFQNATFTAGSGNSTFTISQDNVPTTITGGSGSETYNVNSNSTNVIINGGGGNSTFNVTGNAGQLTLNGGTGANVYTIGANAGTLTLHGNGTSNTVTVTANSSMLNITGGNGTDSYAISGTTGPVNLQAGTGSTAVTINSPVGAGVTVGGSASGGSTTLTYNGTVNAQNFTVTGMFLQDSLSANSVNYSNLAGITINGDGATANAGAQADRFFIQGDSTPTTLNGGSATDQFYVNSFSSQLTINTVSQGLVDIGSTDGPNSPAPASGSLLGSITGTVTVNGHGLDSVNIDDGGNTNPAVATLSAGAYSQGSTTVDYSSIGALGVTMGSAGNTLTVTGTSATTTSVSTGAGNDNINVNATAGGTTTNINTGGGNNTIVVGSIAPTLGGNLDSIQGNVNFTDNPAQADSLTIDDSANTAGRTATLTSTSFTVGLGAIGFSSLKNLSVGLGMGPNTLTITGTGTGTNTAVTNAGGSSDTITVQGDAGPTSITTGGGSSTVYVQATGADTSIQPASNGTIAFFVGSKEPAAGGILDNIQGKLTLNGGANQSLTLDDTGSAGPKTGSLTNTPNSTITGMGMGQFGIIFSNIATLNINLGTGADTFTINGTSAATTNLTSAATTSGDTVNVLADSGTTNITTGGGNDTVNVQATGAGGTTHINTGAGSDVVNLGNKAPNTGGIVDNLKGAITVTGSSALVLNVDDTGSTTAKSDGNLTATDLTGLGTGGVHYTSVTTLNINLGSGGNTFNVASTSATTTTNLNSGAGSDTVYVQSTSGATNIDTGGGTGNTINVGSTFVSGKSDPVAGSVLGGIAGTLSVTGHNSDTVNLDDSGSSTNKMGQLTASQLTGFSPAVINYAAITNFNLYLGTGADTLTIVNTSASQTQVISTATTNSDTINVQNDSNITNVTTGGGSDTVNVLGTGGITNINTGLTGTDTVNLGSNAPNTGGVVDNLKGPIVITGDGSDILNLDDTGSTIAKTGMLTATTITGLGTAGIGYSGIATMNLNLGSGGDTFTISATGAPLTNLTTHTGSGSGPEMINVLADSGTTNINTGNGSEQVNIQTTGTGGTTTVTTGSGSNTINLGSNAPATGGFLDSLKGAIVLKGNGANTTVNLDDTGTANAKTGSLAGTLTSASITGLNTAGVTYSAIGTLNINLGNHGNTFTIASTSANTTTTLTGGSGGDTIDVQSTAGPATTTINTGSGTNLVDVSNTAPGHGIVDSIKGLLVVNGHGTDTLTLDDTGSTSAKSGTLTNSTITGLNMGSAGVTYHTIHTLNIDLGSGSDTMNVQSTAAGTTTTIDTGGGTNLVCVGSTAPVTGGVLANIAGTLNINGHSLDTLKLDDTGNTSQSANGVLTDTAITGLSPGVINYAGIATLNINLGSPSSGGNTFTINNTFGSTVTNVNMGNGNDMLSVTGIGGPAVVTVDGMAGNNTANVNFAGDFAANSTLDLLNFAQTTLNVRNFLGILSTTHTTNPTPDNLTATITGNDWGTLTADTVTSISLPNGNAKTAAGLGTGLTGQVLQITQAGVSRQIDATIPGTNTGINSTTVGFKIFYDGSSAAVPQAAVRVTNTGSTSFDLVLACSSTATRFDLARVDAVGTSRIQNVAVSGNLLGSVTAAETSFFGYASGTVGGVALPNDNLAGVEVRDDLHSGSVSAKSIEGIAMSTLGGTPVASLNGTLAAGALASGTTVVEGNAWFRVPVGEEAPVALYVDTANDAHLNDLAFNLTDQAIDGKDVTAVMDIVSSVSHNQYRVTTTEIDFYGNGGSLSTQEPVSGVVTSTGSLGDLMLQSGLNMTSITAASIIGSINLFGGSLTGILQTTSGDIGRVIYSGSTPTGVTSITAQLPAGSQIVSRGNLISQINTGTIGGIIAAQGNIGVGFFNGSTLTRFGGIVASGLSSGADILSLSNIIGDINISGSVAGRIGAKGSASALPAGLPATETGILGNVAISLAKGGAVVSGNLIGDATRGTSINLSSFSGFLAAVGAIKFNASSKTNGSFVQGPLSANNLAEINNIFNSAATFDSGGNLMGLSILVADLNKLMLSGTTLSGDP